MKIKILPFFIALLMCLSLSYSLKSQPAILQAKQAIIVNGGMFEFTPPFTDFVTVSAYDYQFDSTGVFDTIFTQSAQDIYMDTNAFYVAAADSIVMYNVSLKRMASQSFGAPSTIKLSVYQDLLLVGNWFGSSDNNLRIFDKTTLDFVDSIPELAFGAKDFVIWNDTAYIQQNYTDASFADSAGFLAVVDLTDFSVVRNIEFSNSGEDLGRLLIWKDQIIGLNAGSNTISTYDLKTGKDTTFPVTGDIVGTPYGQKFFALKDTLFFQYDGALRKMNLDDFTITADVVLDTVTAFTIDTVRNDFIATKTDFATYSNASIYSSNGMSYRSLEVGFSPEAVGIIYGYFGGTNSISQVDQFKLYPNPTADLLNISSKGEERFDVVIFNAIGSRVFEQTETKGNVNIDLSQYPSGTYLVSIRTQEGIETKKVIKY